MALNEAGGEGCDLTIRLLVISVTRDRTRSYGWKQPVVHAPDALISKWHIEPGAAVLDLGCGSGELSLWIGGKMDRW
ncbi:hypothetical protein FXV83_16845 [Bradyrhizobium hipponense]|uniref:Methyltransferase n=1 Tax=Bradyrhizobium hipponense TaxID=2605638 RepID=A0A5S4YNX7_9BRAD|nr:hypothetical protein FXV83_16845 [Bradyrhizobium hipponense]